MKIKLLFLMLFASSFLFQSALQAKSEITPFSFLGKNSSARASALSGSFVCFENDVSGVMFNPALLNTVENNKISLTFEKHILDINSGNLVYLFPEYEFGIIAASVNFNSNGVFDYRNKNGNKDGRTFGSQDLSLNVSYASEIDSNFYYGVTVKYIYSGIEKYSTSAFAFDAGLFYKYAERTNLALSVLNAGTQISKLNGESYNLPLDIKAGISQRLKGLPLLINLTFHHLADEEEGFFDRFAHISLGGEFYFGKYIMARIGYNNKVRSEISPDIDRGLSGFSGGVGINLSKYKIDYSISQYGAGAIIHRFTVGLDI